MSKAMVMFDMPKRCEDCPCSCYGLSSDEMMCKITEELIFTEQPIPKWCPLLELDMRTMDSILRAIEKPVSVYAGPIQYIDAHR